MQLGGSAGPVHEEERDLLDAGPVLHEAVVQLDLERVAVGVDPLETDLLQQFAPDTAKTAGGVRD